MSRPRRARAAAGALLLCLCLPLAACGSARHPAGAPASGAGGRGTSAEPADGDQAGSPDWKITNSGPAHAIEGFADRDSAAPGTPVRLFVSTTAATFRVVAYRTGAYRDSQARQVWTSDQVSGSRQPAAREIAATRTPYAPWHPSLTVQTAGWQPGDYLFRLDASNGSHAFVPLTVRSTSTAGRVVVLNATTTWQAYNTWGGRSLYQGSNGAFATRAYAVSFDRPYAFGAGSADFLGNELPLVTFADSLHVPLAYATDTDLDADPHLLDGARAVISMGHDEYYSTGMRAALTAARDRGTNIAFLGANAAYRHIRLGPTPLGPGRLETDYKSFQLDPERLTDPAEATPQWREPPDPRPESALTGALYECNGVSADMVVADPQAWPLAGLGLHAGQALHQLVGDEYDSYQAGVLSPHPIHVLFDSPLTCHGRHGHADATYYTTPSGAGVFDSGTSSWECALDWPACAPGKGDAAAQEVVRGVTRNLLLAFAAGPAGRAHPTTDSSGAGAGGSGGAGGYGMPGSPPPSVPPPSSQVAAEPGLSG